MDKEKSVYLEDNGLYRIGKYVGLKSTKVKFSGTRGECEQYIEEKVNPKEKDYGKMG